MTKNSLLEYYMSVYGNDKDGVNSFAMGFSKAWEILEQDFNKLPDNNGWVSVEDSLPDKVGEDYLVVVKNKNKEGGIYLYDVAQFNEDKRWDKAKTWENVTHWQPLPQPPRP